MFDPVNYTLSVYGVLPITVGFIMFLLGLIVFAQNNKSTVNISYLLLSFNSFIWLTGVGMFNMSHHLTHAAMWYEHYAYFGILLMGPSVYTFFLAVTRKRLKLWAYIVMFSVPVVCFLSNLKYKYVISGAVQFFWGYSLQFTPSGWIIVVHNSVFYMVLAIILLFTQWRKSQPGVERKRLNMLMLSYLIAQLALIDFVPPLGYEVYPCGYIALFIWAILLCWTIVKYKFMIISPEKVAKEVLNLSPNFLVLADLEGNILSVNKFVETVLGYSAQELQREHLRVIMQEEDLSTMMPRLHEEGRMSNVQTAFLSKSGQKIPVLFSAVLVPTGKVARRGMICVAQDISELKKSQEELSLAYQELQSAQTILVHAEKMASVGTLAAGLAHEIHLPLESLNVSLSKLTDDFSSVPRAFHRYDKMLREDTDIDEETKESVNEELQRLKEEHDFVFIEEGICSIIHESMDGICRIENIVVNLKNFSKPDRGLREDVDLNSVIEQALFLVDNQIRYKCAVSKGYTRLPLIRVNVNQIKQVFVNLFLNACHAIEKKGRIHIQTDVAGQEIVVELKDNGRGIEKDKLDKIFDPFYTTEELGKGTGLGLSIVYGIIENHGGRISVQSEVGQGARFTIHLPIKGGLTTGDVG